MERTENRVLKRVKELRTEFWTNKMKAISRILNLAATLSDKLNSMWRHTTEKGNNNKNNMKTPTDNLFNTYLFVVMCVCVCVCSTRVHKRMRDFIFFLEKWVNRSNSIYQKEIGIKSLIYTKTICAKGFFYYFFIFLFSFHCFDCLHQFTATFLCCGSSLFFFSSFKSLWQ